MQPEQGKCIGAFFWRKLDHPGHDSCRLYRLPLGWRLAGMAVFRESGAPNHFAYEVTTDANWHTQTARVTGFRGNRPIDLRIRCGSRQRWRMNGVPQPALSHCIDLDLGFTPATNLVVLRRLALATGDSAAAPAAYLEFPRLRLIPLPQMYRRIGRRQYEYEAPTAGYRGILRVSSEGAIEAYPGLFERVVAG